MDRAVAARVQWTKGVSAVEMISEVYEPLEGEVPLLPAMRI